MTREYSLRERRMQHGSRSDDHEAQCDGVRFRTLAHVLTVPACSEAYGTVRFPSLRGHLHATDLARP